MTQEKPTPQGEHSTKTIDPPLISLIPIPDLAIDNFLAYGAAYYPWLRTTVLSDNDIDGEVMCRKRNSRERRATFYERFLFLEDGFLCEKV